LSIVCKTEDDVKISVLLPFLEGLGYKTAHCEFNKAIEVQEGRKLKSIFADVVVYSSAAKTAPLILCETKAPNEILNRFVREQAISYARLLPRIAPLVLITNGHQFQFFQTLNKNRIPELPRRKDLERDVVNFLVREPLNNHCH
jgi:type I restriction enzyme M protein